MSDPKHSPPWQFILVVVLLIALAVTTFTLVRNVQQFKAQGVFASVHAHPFHRLSITPPTIDSIASWMTFDYLNHVFKLAPATLKTTLSITDAKYPRLSIAGFARDNNVSASVALTRVQTALHTATGK